MHINEFKEKGYPFGGGNRQDLLACLDYVDQLAAEHGVDIGHWNVALFVGGYRDGWLGGEQKDAAPSKPELLKAFKAQIDLLTPEEKIPRLKTFPKDHLEYLREWYGYSQKDAKAQVAGAERNLANYTAQLEAIAANLAHVRAIADPKSVKAIDVRAQIEEILEGGFYRWHKHEIVGKHNVLWFTTPAIHVAEVNKAAKLDLRVNLGEMLVALRISTGRIELFPFKDNCLVGNAIHPYVMQGPGGICWGTASAQFADCMKRYDFVGVMKLLQAILHTTGSDAFVILNDFHAAIQRKRDAAFAKAHDGKSPDYAGRDEYKKAFAEAIAKAKPRRTEAAGRHPFDGPAYQIGVLEFDNGIAAADAVKEK